MNKQTAILLGVVVVAGAALWWMYGRKKSMQLPSGYVPPAPGTDYTKVITEGERALSQLGGALIGYYADENAADRAAQASADAREADRLARQDEAHRAQNFAFCSQNYPNDPDGLNDCLANVR